MSKRSLIIFSILLLFTLTILRGEVCALDAVPQIGKHAPQFELPDVNAKKIRLSDFNGKVVLLNFWATWCGPCKAEMPALNTLYNSLNKRGFVVLAVSTDSSERAVRSFIKEKSLAFPVLMDKDQEVSFDQYAALALPVSFLIDRKGTIREKFIGEIKWDSPEIKNKIEKLVESPPAGSGGSL